MESVAASQNYFPPFLVALGSRRQLEIGDGLDPDLVCLDAALLDRVLSDLLWMLASFGLRFRPGVLEDA